MFVDNTGKQTADIINKSTGTGSFRDLTLKDEYKGLKAKFGIGANWLRFFPPVAPSTAGWILQVDLYRDKAGVTFVSPRSLDDRQPDPFVEASIWLAKNKKELKYSKATPEGFKLWAMPYGIAWALDSSKPEGERLRLVVASLYDGSRGGTQGLASKIVNMVEARDEEPGSPTHGQLANGDIIGASEGRLVNVQKVQPEGKDYASYTVGVGKNPMPMDSVMSQLTDAELERVTALENVIHIPTTEEVHGYLKAVIGEGLHKEIFG